MLSVRTKKPNISGACKGLFIAIWISTVSTSALAVDSTEGMDPAEAADRASCQASKHMNETGPQQGRASHTLHEVYFGDDTAHYGELLN